MGVLNDIFSSPSVTQAPPANTGSAPSSTPNSMPSSSGVDPYISALVKGIGMQEQGGKLNAGSYTAIGDNGHSAGMYQWNDPTGGLTKGQIPANFISFAKTVGADPSDFSPANQDKVAYLTMKQWNTPVAQGGLGLTPQQIASKWNSGNPNAYLGNAGYNAQQGVTYDTPTYVKNVARYASQFLPANNNQNANTSSAPASSSPDSTIPNESDPILGASNFLNSALDAYQTNAGQANQQNGVDANGNPLPTGTGVGNFLGGLEGMAPGQGTLVGNLLRVPEALASGLAKIPFAIAGNLAQTEGSIANKLGIAATGNSALNQSSPTGQAFAASLRGQDFLQKTGKTAGDIATMVADPGKFISGVGDIGSQLPSIIPKVTEGSNIAKGLAFAGRGAAEGAVLSPLLQGQLPTLKSTLFNAAGSAVLSPLIGNLGKMIFPSLGEAAANKSLAELETNLSKTHSPGDPGITANPNADPKVVAQAQKLKDDFNSGFQKYVDNAGITQGRNLDAANQKFTALAEREAANESAVTGKTVAPNAKTLANYLFDTNGGIDGVDKEGYPIMQSVKATQQGIMDKLGPVVQNIYDSSNQTVDPTAIRNSVLSDIESGKFGKGGKTQQAAIDAVNKIMGDGETTVGDTPVLNNPKATPGELNTARMGLNDDAYKDLSKTNLSRSPQTDIESQMRRTIALRIQDLLDNKVTDVDEPASPGSNKALTTEIRDRYNMAVTARDAANTIENIKAPQNLTNKIIGRAAGSALGYGALGVPGAIMGAYGGAEEVSRLQQAFGDLNLSNDIMARYAEKANTQQIDALKNAADDLIAKNQTTAAANKAAEASKPWPAGGKTLEGYNVDQAGNKTVPKGGSVTRQATPEEAKIYKLIQDVLGDRNPKQLPSGEGVPRFSRPTGPTIAVNPAGGATIEPTGPTTLAGKYNAAAGPQSSSLTPSKLRAIMERNAASEPYTPTNKLPRIKF